MSDASREPMRCPTDGTRLVEMERADVLIDACPTCRGVWLDRGELDKILVKERALAAGGQADEDFYAEMAGRRDGPPRAATSPPAQDRHYDDRDRRKRRKRSFLEELLDFD